MKHPSAASILYSIVITTVIIVTAGTMSASFIRANQRNMDMYRSTQAYYAARAAMEEGIAASADANELGFEASNTTAINWAPVNATGEYQVFSRSKGLNWRDPTSYTAPVNCSATTPEDCYVMPIPGTGTAGGTDCDVNNPTQPSWSTDINDDCNWNKIEYQETVSIPLYYEDASSTCAGGLCNPAETQLTNFILRVRTPGGDLLDGNDAVIVNWEISGDCDTNGLLGADETCYMVANKGTGVLDLNNSQIMADNTDHGINDRNDVLVMTYPSFALKALSNQVLGTTNASWFMRAKWLGPLPSLYLIQLER